MGVFSSKKKTFSGVGSAVQNLLSNPLEDVVVTATTNAIINEKDLGENFKSTLSSGMGSKLRSFIDYAHQKGYTNTIGWGVSDITGETFSDASLYATYLNKYVYPNSNITTTTPEVVVKDFNETIDSYLLGNDEIIEKTYTRIKSKTTTVNTTNYDFQINWYYQGSNTTQYSISKFFNDPKYASIPENVLDTAKFWDNAFPAYRAGDVLDLSSPGEIGSSWLYNGLRKLRFSSIAWNKNYPLDVLWFQYSGDLPLTEEGTVMLATAVVLREEAGYTTSHRDWGDEGLYWYDVFHRCSVEELTTQHMNFWQYMEDPYTTLNLSDKTKCHLCKASILADSEIVTTSTSTNCTLTWDRGYALLIPNTVASSDRILVGNVDVTKTKNKTVSTIETEYHITEKWVNGVLVSFDEIEGAINSSISTTETLENTTFTHTDEYIYGSGNSNLDAIINTTTKFTEQFCPVMPIKVWGNMINSSYHSDWYQAERKLYKKLTGKTLNKWDEFIDSFKNVGDSAKMVYYFNSIPINMDTDFANEYFFHFFKWLAINFGGSYIGCSLGFRLGASVDSDFWLGYSMNLHWRIVKGTCPIPCKIHGYARFQHIGQSEADDTTSKSWKGGFSSRNWALYNAYNSVRTSVDSTPARENFPDLTDSEYEQLRTYCTYTYTKYSCDNQSTITFYYKINEHLYEKVYVSNFTFTHYVRGTGLTYFLKTSLKKDWQSAIDDDATNTANAGFAPIIIPIARGALESMGWLRQSNVYQVTHNVIIAGYEQKTIKVKWYQRGIFSFIFIVVAIVITIYSCGTAAPVTAAATAGATAGTVAAGTATFLGITMNALAAFALKAITCALICKAITYAANKYIGGTTGAIVGAVASFVACAYVSFSFDQAFNLTTQTTTFWESFNSFDGYMKLAQSFVDVGNQVATNKLNQQYASYQNDYTNWQNTQQSQAEQVNKWNLEQNSWGNDNITNILVQSTYTSSYDASKDSSFNSYLIAEDPDTFFNRVFDLDFYDLNASYISNFEDYLFSDPIFGQS